MPTNAQAALAASATTFSKSGKYVTEAQVKLRAESFKKWLDWHDAQEIPEPEQRDTALDALVERADPPEPPFPIGFRA